MNKYWIATVFVGSVAAGFISGCQYRSMKADKELAQAEALFNAQLVEKSKEMQSTVDELNAKHYEEQKNAEETVNKLRADIRSGSVRMFVNTTSVSSDSSVGGSSGRAELSREDAEEILDIASTGDDWGRKLNQCIDQYNSVRSQMK